MDDRLALAHLIDQLEHLVATRGDYPTAGDLAGRIKVLLLKLEASRRQP